MPRDEPTYGDLMRSTEPYYDDRDSRPAVEVRETRTQVRNRHSFVNEAEVRAQFFVVHHEAEEVLFAGDPTTGDHHNPYQAARDKALGFASGFKAGDPFL